jgi:hypothetical protein
MLRACRRPAFGAASIALTLGLLGIAGPPAAADPPADWPVGVWAVCLDAQAQNCIASATVTPEGGTPTPVEDYGLRSYVATSDGAMTSFNWGVGGLDNPALPAEVRDGTLNLEIRVGRFAPRYTLATAKELSVTRTATGNGNTTVLFSGRPVHIDWTTGPLFTSCVAGSDCGGPDTTADATGSGYRFGGNTQDLVTWGEPYVSTLDGFYLASDAQGKPSIVQMFRYPEAFWSIPALGNPHLDLNGNAARGSFNAWIPPRYFSSLHTNAENAARIGFDVVGVEGGTAVSLPFSARVRDDGVAIDVPYIGYSIRTVNVYNRKSTMDGEATVPDVPRSLTVEPAAGRLGAAWEPPLSDGGPEVESYRARAFRAAEGGSVVGSCTATAPITSCDIPGLNDGTTYWVTVSAVNRLGEGESFAPRVVGVPTAR